MSCAMTSVMARKAGPLGRLLDDAWQQWHRLIIHAECRPIASKSFKKMCFAYGVCVCSGEGSMVYKLWRRVFRATKAACPLDDTALLTDGHLVLMFDKRTDDDDGAEELAPMPSTRARWAHVSHFVGSPANAYFLELENARPSEEDPRATRLDVSVKEPIIDAFYSACGFLAEFGVNAPCRVAIYRMLGVHEHRVVAELCAQDVEVVKHMDEFVVLQGHDALGAHAERDVASGPEEVGAPSTTM